MKVRKFIKRERRTAGRATGSILCRFSLPTIGEEYEIRRSTPNPARTVDSIRKFIEWHLPKSFDLQIGASFIIQAEIRASGGGLRRKQLAKWKFGEKLDSIFKKAEYEWSLLELEEDWSTTEVEVDI